MVLGPKDVYLETFSKDPEVEWVSRQPTNTTFHAGISRIGERPDTFLQRASSRETSCTFRAKPMLSELTLRNCPESGPYGQM